MNIKPVLIVSVAVLSSCSTTRSLSEGQYRLASNKVVFTDDNHDLRSSDVSSYVKQQPNTYFLFGWNPFLNIYNWADPKSDKWPSTMWRKIGVAPVVFNPSLLGSSEENILRHLSTLGYYHAKISESVDTTRRLVDVTYTVTPGSRVVIDSLVYKFPDGEFAADFISDTAGCLVHKGDFLSEQSLESESTRSASALRNKGYYDFNKNNYFFEADTLGERNILHYEVRGYTRNENPSQDSPIKKYDFGDVSIAHPSDLKFNDRVLRDLCLIKPGMPYNEDVVNATYSRLAKLKVFNNVNIELEPRDSSLVDCNIRLGKSKLQGFRINLEASSSSNGLIGISPQVNFYHKNIFHGGERLSIGLNGNFQFKPKSDARSTEFGVNASLSLPRMVGLPYSVFKGPNIPGTEFKTSFNYQNRPEFTRTLMNFSMQYNGQIFNRFYFQFSPLSATFVRLFDIDSEFYKVLVSNPYLWDSYYDHSDIGVNTVLYWTTNSDIVPKTPYQYVRLGIDASGNLISLFDKWLPLDDYGQRTVLGLPYSRYVKAELNLGKIFRFGYEDRQQLALHFVAGAGYVPGSGTTMPFEKQFYVGGASSMRGWQARALGPGFQYAKEFFSIPSQTGDYKLEFDLEYRFSLFWKLEGALFAETGNVWSYDSSANNQSLSYNFSDYLVDVVTIEEPWIRSLAADWGLGIRVNLDFILLRLDGGFKVYNPGLPYGKRWLAPKDWFSSDGFSIHFGVGYPF